jgi:hypothetical protein
MPLETILLLTQKGKQKASTEYADILAWGHENQVREAVVMATKRGMVLGQRAALHHSPFAGTRLPAWQPGRLFADYDYDLLMRGEARDISEARLMKAMQSSDWSAGLCRTAAMVIAIIRHGASEVFFKMS